MKLSKVLTVSILLLIIGVSISVTVSAESNYACAAVYPCDANGNLLKEFAADGPCFDYYVNQCLITKLQITKSNLQSCQFKNINLEGEVALNEVLDENDKLRNQKRRLKRKLKRLKSR